MTSFETGLCLLHRVRVMSEDSDPCLVSHVSSPITDKSSLSSAPPALSLLSLSRCIFPSSGSGQGTREITRPGPGPASCQLTRKIPGLNWLTPAAKYFADCEYFSSGSGTETLAQGRGEAGPGLRFTIVRVCVAVVCGSLPAQPQFALFNGEFSTLARSRG